MSKKYDEAKAKIEAGKAYTPLAAVSLVKEIHPANFDETVEVHFRLGIDTRQADQQLRGTVSLPNGSGKTVRVAVFAEGDAARAAEEAGADGVLLVTPYYNKATQKGLIAHYTAIANSVKLPIIMYNVPSRTGCNIQPETAVTLAKNVENIVAIKEASGNISQVAKLMSLADGCIDLYSGNDDQIVPILSLGGKGVISVTSNIIPNDTHTLVKKYLDGDVKGALDLQLKAIELCNALFCEVNPIPVKKAVELLGLCDGYMRMPLSEMEPQNAERLKKAMTEYGVLK